MVTSTVKFRLVIALTIVMLLSSSICSSPITVMAKSNSGNTTSALENKSALKKRTVVYVPSL